MMDIITSYNQLEEQKLWEAFLTFFREVKGYTDWTDEDIALSYNKGDVEEFVNWIRKVLGVYNG